MKIYKEALHPRCIIRRLPRHFAFVLGLAMLAAGLSTSAQSRLDGPILQLLADASPASPLQRL